MATEQKKSIRNLLQDKNIRYVFVAYLVTFMGTAMAPIAMAFGVLELTGSTKDSAIVIAAPVIASIAVLLLGGVIADRSSRQKVIISADSAALLIQLAMAYLFLSEQATVPLLTGLMLLNGIAVAFNAPAASGFIIQLVDKEDLQSINALLGSARNLALILGAALGGVLVSVVGAGWTIFLDALSFGVSALLVYLVKPKQQIKSESESILLDLKLGWGEFIAHKWVWVIVVQFAFVVAANEAIIGLIGPAVALDQLKGAEDWGLVVSAIGVGTLIGGLIGFRLNVRYPMRFATFCVLVPGLLPIALAFPLPLYGLMLIAVLEGIGWQLFGVLWMTTLQTKIKPHLLSRVCAYDYIGSVCLAPIGIILAGIFYESMGFRWVLLAAALVIILPTVFALLVKEVWFMQLDEPVID
ncbi:MFS transporter [Reinekea forsetii]|nr:MFS transporter [Reinekea forsetii]